MPSTVYRGSFLFQIARIGMSGLSILFLGAIVIFPLFALIKALQETISSGANIADLRFVALFVAITSLIGIRLFLILIHMYSEIGTSSDALWYRYWFGWKSIPWEQISDVEAAKMSFSIKIGLLVYSERLPFYHRFYGKAYGSGKGRALLIANRLKGFERLNAEIGQRKHIHS